MANEDKEKTDCIWPLTGVGVGGFVEWRGCPGTSMALLIFLNFMEKATSYHVHLEEVLCLQHILIWGLTVQKCDMLLFKSPALLAKVFLKFSFCRFQHCKASVEYVGQPVPQKITPDAPPPGCIPLIIGYSDCPCWASVATWSFFGECWWEWWLGSMVLYGAQGRGKLQETQVGHRCSSQQCRQTEASV